MCSFSSEQPPYVPLALALYRSSWSSKRHHQHLRLSLHKRRRAQLQEARRRRNMTVLKAEIKMRNLKLYMENQSIIEKNEKLRKQAVLLHKENQALLLQLQKKFAEQNNITTN
ncbi:hypothetical protein Fmac_011884 [Flemingia macrophylla]|uniref:Uncharacterized protein n=1 Tax=Flemingia macrophylla TaxID=520843 RepID=A0ABD1MNP4_9FABA